MTWLDHGDDPDQNLKQALSRELLRVGVRFETGLAAQMAAVRAVC